jgi:hypothetical protein
MPETQPDFTAEMLLSRTFRLEISWKPTDGSELHMFSIWIVEE